MLTINDQHFDAAYFSQKHAEFAQIPALSAPKGKRFALCIQDPAEMIALILYLKQHEASCFPLSPESPYEAALRQAKRSQCNGLIFDSASQYISLDEHTQPSEACLIQMSSGSTGEPKILERSWTEIDLEVESYCAAFPEADQMVPVIACPTHHSYGLISGLFVAMHRGARPTILTNMNPKYIIRKLCDTPQHLLYASPMLIHSVTLLYPKDQKLHAVMTSGTAMREALFQHLCSRATYVYQQYGCSEAGCISISHQPESPEDVGTPLQHLQVEAGSDAEHATEIVVLRASHRIQTSDLGYKGANGRLHCIARIDDMINVAGINVYPAEVENVVVELKGIEDAVAYKAVNRFGHVQVCLQYVAEDALCEQEIRDWCALQLSPHQRPQILKRVPRIPRMPNGKINRKQLADNPSSAETVSVS